MEVDITFSLWLCLVQEIRCKTRYSVVAQSEISENVKGPKLQKCTEFNAFMKKWTFISYVLNRTNKNSVRQMHYICFVSLSGCTCFRLANKATNKSFLLQNKRRADMFSNKVFGGLRGRATKQKDLDWQQRAQRGVSTEYFSINLIFALMELYF